MIFSEVKYATFCSHNLNKSMNNKIQLKCLDQYNLTHEVSQYGKICNKCSELLIKSLTTIDHCIVCSQQIQSYLKEKEYCPHQDQQFDQASIKCLKNHKQIHYIPLKAKVCKICLNKISAAFNMSQSCKVCSGNQKQILQDFQKNIISATFISIKNIISYLKSYKVSQSSFKCQLQSFCLAQPHFPIKSIIPPQLIQSNNSQSHLSKRYSLYPKCVTHRNKPINVCNKCLVGVLNVSCCPYGCQYKKQLTTGKKMKKEEIPKVSQTGFLCMYPQTLGDTYYLDLFVIRQTEEKTRLDRWESSLRKVRPLNQLDKNYSLYFALYGASVLCGNKMYLYCGGVVGRSIQTRQASNHSFLLRLTQDFKNFYIQETQLMQHKRASHTLVYHQQADIVFAIGGFIKGEGCLKSCEYYQRKQNKWTQFASLNIQRSKPTAFIYHHQLYVFGGMSTNPQFQDCYAQKLNKQKNIWQPLAFNGYDYPSLTGSSCLTTIPYYQNKQALWMFGGSNYQDYSTMVQSLQIGQNGFSLNVDTYLMMSHPHCNATLGMINDDLLVVFGGGKEHQSALMIDVVKIRSIKDFVQPMFAYQEVELGSYRLMLRESAENVYSKLFQTLQQEDIISKQKLNKDDTKLSSNYNSHMLQKMFYSIGKSFVWVQMDQKKQTQSEKKQ